MTWSSNLPTVTAQLCKRLFETSPKHFSLEAKLCIASHYEHEHRHYIKLSGHEVLLQVAGQRQRLALRMHFEISAAFYIWQSFRKGIWQTKDADKVMNAWITAAEACSTQGCIAASVANSSAFLPALLLADPLHTLNIARGQHAKCNTSLDPYKLPQVEPLTRALLLFAQLLTGIAAEFNSITASITSTAGADQLRSAIASKLQQLTSNSCCTPVLSTDPSIEDRADVPQPMAEPSKRVLLLRSAVLLLKLATLTFNIKADFLPGQQNGLPSSRPFRMPSAVRSLWYVISSLSLDLLRRTEPYACSKDSNQEEITLAVALFEHLVLTLRQCVKDPSFRLKSELPHVVACLKLLTAVLHTMHPVVVRHEVKRLGALPLAAAFLDSAQGWEAGRLALEILDLLCSPAVDMGGQHADLLAKLHPVRRLSEVLFTVNPFKEEPNTAAGPKACAVHGLESPSIQQQAIAEAASACSPRDLSSNVDAALTAVCLLLKTLELHPLSQRLPSGASGAMPVGKDALTVEDTKTGQCGTTSNASTQAPTSCQLKKWPTPKPKEWQDVELVAVRAFNTLGWVAYTMSATQTGVKGDLVQRLCQLLQHLVAGHLPDLDLDMQTLFEIGLQPVLSAQVKGLAGSEGLAAAMLSRLATDNRLMLQAQVCAHQICHIFGCLCSTEVYVVSDSPVAVPLPSALFIAIVGVLHLAVARLEDEQGPAAVLARALDHALSGSSDRLVDKMMLCACLGALTVEGEALNRKLCHKIISAFTFKRSYNAVFTALEQVMQAPRPWDEELCFAAATMLDRCGNAVLLQSPSCDPRCEGMQTLLVQLLQQLQSSNITADQALQRVLLHGCCKCLHCLALHPGATDHSAVVPAMTYWISALEMAIWEHITPTPHPIFQIIGPRMLMSAKLLETLLCTVTSHLDSQQKWHNYAQTGLSTFLITLHKSMLREWPMVHGIDVLSTASKYQAFPTSSLAVDRDIAVLASAHDTTANQDQAEADNVLIRLWRRVGCVAITLLSQHCGEACQLHHYYQGMLEQQVQRKLLQKKYSQSQNEAELEQLQVDLPKMVVKLAEVQKQLDNVVPALHGIQQEPAWSSIMDGHQPEDWSDSEPPPDRRCHLVYLYTQNVLSHDHVLAFHSFYNFMLGDSVDPTCKAEEASAAAAAEELIAEEAREAAQAAAKKAKKKKAKARKQQARSDATAASASPASEACTGASLQSQQDVGPMATLEQSSPSGTRGCDMPSDHIAGGLQMQLQHMTVPNCAMPTIHEPAAKDEQVLISPSTDVCESAGSAMAHGNSPGDNATFLDQLFCCPITKVVMVDPVIAADGHTYERTAIQHWLQGSSLSPVTKDKLSHTRLVPNVLAKAALAQHAQET